MAETVPTIDVISVNKAPYPGSVRESNEGGGDAKTKVLGGIVLSQVLYAKLYK